MSRFPHSYALRAWKFKRYLGLTLKIHCVACSTSALRAISQPQAVFRKCFMQSIAHFFASFFSSSGQADDSSEACSLFERASLARGLSPEDAAQLRINAMAMLSVVR
jgi:hypothetical protein